MFASNYNQSHAKKIMVKFRFFEVQIGFKIMHRGHIPSCFVIGRENHNPMQPRLCSLLMRQMQTAFLVLQEVVGHSEPAPTNAVPWMDGARTGHFFHCVLVPQLTFP
jgi:hypothetical protein